MRIHSGCQTFQALSNRFHLLPYDADSKVMNRKRKKCGVWMGMINIDS